MKNTILASLIVFGFAAANARSMVPNDFELAKATVSPAHSHAGAKAVGGSFSYFGSDVSLEIEMKIICPPGMACIALYPKQISLHLPIVHSQTSGCGDRYIAQEVDEEGILHKLEIIDYSNAFCQIHIENVIHVKYKTIQESLNGLYQTFESSFEFTGRKVEPIYFP